MNRIMVLPSNSIQCFVLIIFLILLHMPIIRAEENYIYLELCSHSDSYTSGSRFQANLNLLLSSLRSNGSRDGYFNTSVGVGPNIVYGLAQCRDDLSVEVCRTCLDILALKIFQTCPNGTEATLRYDRCILHYSSTRFFSDKDTSPGSSIWESKIPKADAVWFSFSQQLGVLLKSLSKTAISKQTRYSSGDTVYISPGRIYGMVQCTRDLSPSGCDYCLEAMISYIPVCCNRNEGAAVFSTTCYIRYDVIPFLEEASQSPSPFFPASPPQPSTTSHGTSTEEQNRTDGKSINITFIIVPVFASVFLLAICAFFITRRVHNKKRKAKSKFIAGIRSEAHLQFDLDTIRTATNEFSKANKLGEGGFGAVYKGQLLDGQEIAVKKLSITSQQGLREFRNEIDLLFKVQHKNLVKLLGYCDQEETLLIYEFVLNTSLDKYIFDPEKKSRLDWPMRYNIIGGIARGLCYLHEDSRLKIIHGDLKAGNILLDEKMNAKIADFGTAKLFALDQTRVKVTNIIGTWGYIAPEHMGGNFAVKSDVFSFGILLLEIVSGQKTSSFHPSDLPSYAWNLWNEGDSMQLMDSAMLSSFSTIEVMRCIHIGLLCVQHNCEDRPTMSSVVIMLSADSIALKTPKNPAYRAAEIETERDVQPLNPR